jgi:hypothetical protein
LVKSETAVPSSSMGTLLFFSPTKRTDNFFLEVPSPLSAQTQPIRTNSEKKSPKFESNFNVISRPKPFQIHLSPYI